MFRSQVGKCRACPVGAAATAVVVQAGDINKDTFTLNYQLAILSQ
jgi:hypothetical protein